MFELPGYWKKVAMWAALAACVANIKIGSFNVMEMLKPILGIELYGINLATVVGGFGAIYIISQISR